MALLDDMLRIMDTEYRIRASLARQARNSIIRILTLPSELLLEITLFSLSAPCPEAGPGRISQLRKLSQVCSYWRKLLHEAPAIWATFSPLEPRRDIGLALARSLDSPLTIEEPSKSLPPHLRPTVTCEVVQDLLPHVGRWRRISLRARRPIEPRCVSNSARILESLDWELDHFWRNTPSGPTFSAPGHAPSSHAVHRLTSLVLRLSPEPESRDGLFQLISTCTALKSLKLSGGGLDDDAIISEAASEAIGLKRLCMEVVHLHLDCGDVSTALLGMLDLTQCTDFSISCVSITDLDDFIMAISIFSSRQLLLTPTILINFGSKEWSLVSHGLGIRLPNPHVTYRPLVDSILPMAPQAEVHLHVHRLIEDARWTLRNLDRISRIRMERCNNRADIDLFQHLSAPNTMFSVDPRWVAPDLRSITVESFTIAYADLEIALRHRGASFDSSGSPARLEELWVSGVEYLGKFKALLPYVGQIKTGSDDVANGWLDRHVRRLGF